jgi:hypothetical protein
MIIENTNQTEITGEGFYNSDGVYAPNFVYAPDFELLKELKDTYTYPYNGWIWASDSQAAASWFVSNQ